MSIGPASAGTARSSSIRTPPTRRHAPRGQAAVDRFQRENPEVSVEFNVYDHESYKKAIRDWLTGSPPDVVFWFAGNRMRQFVTPGLLEDLSDLYDAEARARMHPSALELVSHGGRQFGVPYTYYQVGLYYRRDVLEAAGIAEPPRTFAELVAPATSSRRRHRAVRDRHSRPVACRRVVRLSRSARQRLRVPHVADAGSVAYTDPRVRAVFDHWRTLLDHDCFSRGHASSSWQESQALLYQGKAAMMLIGNYIVANFPPEMRDRMEFARFPTLRPKIGRFEEAPMNTVHVPARAVNKEEARRFMPFVMRADVQEALNKAMLQLPVNTDAAIADDRFLRRAAISSTTRSGCRSISTATRARISRRSR